MIPIGDGIYYRMEGMFAEVFFALQVSTIVDYKLTFRLLKLVHGFRVS